MARFPLFGYPNRYPYYGYYRNPYRNQNIHETECTSNMHTSENFKNETDENKTKDYDTKWEEKDHVQAEHRSFSSFPFSFNMNGMSDKEEPIIEILGIKLYLDDLIILGLLFILYTEEVKDEMLFISLILLLLT